MTQCSSPNSSSSTDVSTASPEAMQRVLKAFFQAKRVVVTGHVRPDGDAVGATLALVGYLQGAGQQAIAVGLAPLPESLLFLEGIDTLVPAQHYKPQEGDVLCLVDCATEDRLQFPLRPLYSTMPLVIIDHHWPKSPYPTEAVYAIPDASSTCELIWNLAQAAGWKATHSIAEALWTGLITDTNRFSYPCSTPSTLRCAAALLEGGGIRTQLIADESYHLVSEKRLRLQDRLIRSIQLYCGGTLSVGVLYPEDYASEHATTADSNNFVDIPRFIRGVEVAAFVYPGRNGAATCLSLRTLKESHNAATFCAQWNGGGHARAAGATIDQPVVETLPMLLEALQRFAQEGL